MADVKGETAGAGPGDQYFSAIALEFSSNVIALVEATEKCDIRWNVFLKCLYHGSIAFSPFRGAFLAPIAHARHECRLDLVKVELGDEPHHLSIILQK